MPTMRLLNTLSQFIERREERWVSEEIRAVPAQLSKARLILGICLLFTPPITGILALGWFTFPDSRLHTAVIILGQVLVFSSAFALRWAKSMSLPSALFVGWGTAQLLVATYLTGSVVSPVVYAFPVLVMFASTVAEFRMALWVAGVLLIGGFLIWIPEYPSYSAFTHHAPLHIRVLTLAWCMATALGVAWLYTIENRRSESELRLAIEERDRFLAYLSHELRNPLTAIMGAADLLSTGEPQDPRNRGFIEALQRSAEGMTQVLDDLLDISKADAGMLRLDLSPTPVRPLLEGIVSELGPLAETRGVALRLDARGTAATGVIAARGRLEQVLRNLVTNSLKFTDSGGAVTLRTQVVGTGAVLFEVEDNGIGIEEEDISKILEPFRQAEQGSSSGTGLGLPICSLLLNAMNSSIRIESEVGRGSTFSFQLPLCHAEATVETTATSAAASAVSFSKTTDSPLRVLLADDNDEARSVVCGVLEKLSCTVETAVDGVEALAKIDACPPELLLLDIQMPRLDGVGTATELRRRFAAGELEPFHLVALTGNLNVESVSDRNGVFDQVLSKPVGLTQLQECLESMARAIPRSD